MLSKPIVKEKEKKTAKAIKGKKKEEVTVQTFEQLAES